MGSPHTFAVLFVALFRMVYDSGLAPGLFYIVLHYRATKTLLRPLKIVAPIMLHYVNIDLGLFCPGVLFVFWDGAALCFFTFTLLI